MGDMNNKKREKEEIAAAVDAELSQRFHHENISRPTESVFTSKRPRQMTEEHTHTQNTTFGAMPKYSGPIVNLCQPIAYKDAEQIATFLFNQQVVFVKLNHLDDHVAGRMIDFLTGVVYGIDGDIQRVSDELFICTPTHVEITDDLLDRFEEV